MNYKKLSYLEGIFYVDVSFRVMMNAFSYSAFNDSKKLLRPVLDQAMGVGSGGPQFELRNLVDFSEKLLTSSPIRVDRVRPLIRNPGILMVTDREIYFQV